MKKLNRLEAILWSIALPGFSQLLVGNYVKGVLFVTLEFIINAKGHFNQAIMYSFLGEMNKAHMVTNYQWLMFYPCLYMFAMWDSYRIAMPPNEKYSFLPFVFGAYFLTIGLMYSPKLLVFGLSLGPVFLPMLFLLPGLFIGFLIKFLLCQKS